MCALLVILLLPSPARAEQAPDPPGKIRRFFEEHGARLATSFGLFSTSRVYNRTWGPSTRPLILGEPPAPDRFAHDQWSRRRGARGFVENYGAQALHFGAPLALIALDARDRALMARDLLGFVETTWTNGGLTLLLKDIVGRERPELEYAERDGLDPNARAELEDKPDSHRSFPSGHASASFAVASYLERALARKTGMRGAKRALSFAALYGLAGYISYSRVATDKHYLSDITAGAALGITVSRTFYRLNHPEEFAAGRESRLRGSPIHATLAPAPIFGGPLVMVSLSTEQARQLRQ
ncbi:MAG TPA: phosphatase PAP2 family protein [Candidatus Polarisedimenticolia bacterium]|jgi:membrane-associated phospholipid phosphatase